MLGLNGRSNSDGTEANHRSVAASAAARSGLADVVEPLLDVVGSYERRVLAEQLAEDRARLRLAGLSAGHILAGRSVGAPGQPQTPLPELRCRVNEDVDLLVRPEAQRSLSTLCRSTLTRASSAMSLIADPVAGPAVACLLGGIFMGFGVGLCVGVAVFR